MLERDQSTGIKDHSTCQNMLLTLATHCQQCLCQRDSGTAGKHVCTRYAGPKRQHDVKGLLIHCVRTVVFAAHKSLPQTPHASSPERVNTKEKEGGGEKGGEQSREDKSGDLKRQAPRGGLCSAARHEQPLRWGMGAAVCPRSCADR